HGGSDLYLGTVVDKEKGIFYNRNKGFFKFTIENGIELIATNEAVYYKYLLDSPPDISEKPKIIDFGDFWYLDEMLNSSGLKDIILKTIPAESDTLLALISYNLLDNSANVYAERWYYRSYAQYVYPNAHLQTARISEFLKRVGTEEIMRDFFDLYIPYLKAMSDVSENILIDSTSLVNNINFEFSKLVNHNGVIKKQTRLIYVVERNTSLPVYFRYVAGNIVDVVTLRLTINQLRAQNMNVKHGILDAEYCSAKNIKYLNANDIPFIIRMPYNELAKKIVNEHGSDVCDDKYSLLYNDRIVYIKKVKLMIFSIECYIYICVDANRMYSEKIKHMQKSALNKQKPVDTVAKDKFGYFVFISSESMETSEVMPMYYMRQTIEQTIDILKNNTTILPLGSHSEEAFRGHLLIAFMATIALITIKNKLKKRNKLKDLPAIESLANMRGIKASVYNDQLVTSEPDKHANLIINELKLDVPSKIYL
ncbi:MAG: transposase, partial [Christensenellaceae bacterium]|nr:transposase [Christensenellaceae bacterium]